MYKILKPFHDTEFGQLIIFTLYYSKIFPVKALIALIKINFHSNVSCRVSVELAYSVLRVFREVILPLYTHRAHFYISIKGKQTSVLKAVHRDIYYLMKVVKTHLERYNDYYEKKQFRFYDFEQVGSEIEV